MHVCNTNMKSLKNIQSNWKGNRNRKRRKRVSLQFITEQIQLTLNIELDGGVGHPHHVLCNAGQLEVVVISADVEKSQDDGVGVGRIYICLGKENKSYKTNSDM